MDEFQNSRFSKEKEKFVENHNHTKNSPNEKNNFDESKSKNDLNKLWTRSQLSIDKRVIETDPNKNSKNSSPGTLLNFKNNFSIF